jgi:hypothetical protein
LDFITENNVHFRASSSARQHDGGDWNIAKAASRREKEATGDENSKAMEERHAD